LNLWTEKTHQKWIDVSSKWISYQAIESNPDGLEKASKFLIEWMINIGFEIETYIDKNAPYRPIIVAKKEPKNCEKWIGFFHHYDVEPAVEEDWATNPWKPEIVEGNLVGRGIADNIGPFAQRLLILEDNMPDIGLLFVIQGEEEIGSPWAHQVYPNLVLPEVEFWIDETGYFYNNGDQRILSLGTNETIEYILQRITKHNQKNGIGTKVRNRFMTKAFGENKCPCITHLLKNKPYLAIGPNDDSIRVHGIDEGMKIALLRISAFHLGIIFEEVKKNDFR